MMRSNHLLFFNFIFIVCLYTKTKSAGLKPDLALEIAVQTYVYGYSLVTNEVTRIQMTNSSNSSANVPMGEFRNARTFPPPSYHGAAAPNANTLYSIAWVDLEKEPWFLSHPDMDERFYLFPMYDLYIEEIDDPGERTAGSAAATYAIVGPKWKGSLPRKVKKSITKIIKAPGRFVVIVGRTYCNGTTEDYEIVNSLQDQYLLRPLSLFIKDQNVTYNASIGPVVPVKPDPPFNQTGSVKDVINNMDITTYFNIMTTRMKDNPPSKEDKVIVDMMAQIGVIPGATFCLSDFSPSVQAAIEKAPTIAFKLIEKEKLRLGVLVRGWSIEGDTSTFGTNYIERAAVALYGWVGNNASDAIYASTEVDSKYRKLTGTNNYLIHFAKNQTPPVDAFWSFTIYDTDLFFVPNDENKYSVGSSDALVYNQDGSLDLYFQYESPGTELEPNWLPAPQENFVVMLRMYWPLVSVTQIKKGAWYLPPITKN